jgi:hypothetical protein
MVHLLVHIETLQAGASLDKAGLKPENGQREPNGRGLVFHLLKQTP